MPLDRPELWQCRRLDAIVGGSDQPDASAEMSFNTFDRNEEAQGLWARVHCWRWWR